MRVFGISQGVRYSSPKKSKKPLGQGVSFSGINPKLFQVPLGQVATSVSFRPENFVDMFTPIAQKHCVALFIDDKGVFESGFGRYLKVMTRTKDGKLGPRLYMGLNQYFQNVHLKHWDDATLKGYCGDEILAFFDAALGGKKSFPNSATTGIIMPEDFAAVTVGSIKPKIRPEEWEFGKFKWRNDEQTQRHLAYIQEAAKEKASSEEFGEYTRFDNYSVYMVPEVVFLKDFAKQTGIAGLIAAIKHPAYGHCLQYMTKLPEGKSKIPIDRFVMTTGPLGVHGDFRVLDELYANTSERILPYMNRTSKAFGDLPFVSGNSFKKLSRD